MDIERKIVEHQEILNRHEQQLSELIKTDEALAEDIRILHTKLDIGFTNVREDLKFIREKAFNAIPEHMANSMKINSLVWQVIGVCVSIAFLLYNVIH